MKRLLIAYDNYYGAQKVRTNSNDYNKLKQIKNLKITNQR